MDSFGPGPDGRPDACCPRCGSLERHRFLALLLESLAPAITPARIVLDVAPSGSTTRLFRRLGPERYVRMDFDPCADKRSVDVQASMTDIPLGDDSVDIAVCYHVLEHVPDDHAAVAELARTLSPSGLAFVQVPWRRDEPTDEDPSAPTEERIRRFGQADHVRYYGTDFEERLQKGGLSFLRVTPDEVAGPRLVDMFRFIPDEPVWIVRTDDDRVAADEAGTEATALRQTVLAFLAGNVAKLAGAEERAREAERRAAHWERAYQRLRGRLAVRLLVAASRPVRRRGR